MSKDAPQANFLKESSNARESITTVCNNGLCVNPAHMALLPIQSWIHRSDRKLTEEQVSEIRESAESEDTLAERYGVSHQAIHAIRKFKSYKDVL